MKNLKIKSIQNIIYIIRKCILLSPLFRSTSAIIIINHSLSIRFSIPNCCSHASPSTSFHSNLQPTWIGYTVRQKSITSMLSTILYIKCNKKYTIIKCKREIIIIYKLLLNDFGYCTFKLCLMNEQQLYT
jgi:hypothetical protein